MRERGSQRAGGDEGFAEGRVVAVRGDVSVGGGDVFADVANRIGQVKLFLLRPMLSVEIEHYETYGKNHGEESECFLN